MAQTRASITLTINIYNGCQRENRSNRQPRTNSTRRGIAIVQMRNTNPIFAAQYLND